MWVGQFFSPLLRCRGIVDALKDPAQDFVIAPAFSEIPCDEDGPCFRQAAQEVDACSARADVPVERRHHTVRCVNTVALHYLTLNVPQHGFYKRFVQE